MVNFWNEEIWLSPNVTWDQLSDKKYAQFSDLVYPMYASVLILALRALLEQKLFRKLGRSLGMKEDGAQRGTDTIFFWIQRKLEQRRPTPLDKFTETAWRYSSYLVLHIMGVYIMYSKPWTWQVKLLWYNFPFHEIDDEIWWYYMIELAFYWALCISQFADVKRKDFYEMLLHHFFTISLLVLSWTCHLHRTGALVLLVHDCADHWLEMAKIGRYIKNQKLCDVSFLGFCTVWVTTRIGIYPNWILYASTVEAGQMLEMYSMYYLFNFLLTGLLILHLFWTYFILKAAYKALVFSDDVSDNRSESEDSDYEEEASQNRKKKIKKRKE